MDRPVSAIYGQPRRRRGSTALNNLVRLARQLNGALGRRGKVFADRYHAEVLDSLARIRQALAHVLNNERRHSYKSGWIKLEGCVDPCSSGLFFDGWREKVRAPRGRTRRWPRPGAILCSKGGAGTD